MTTVPFDPAAALAAAKTDRLDQVNKAAGAGMLRIADAAEKALNGDPAALAAALGQTPRPQDPTAPTERQQRPTRERPRRKPRERSSSTEKRNNPLKRSRK